MSLTPGLSHLERVTGAVVAERDAVDHAVFAATSPPVWVDLDKLLTVDGKIPLTHAREMLAEPDGCLLRHLNGAAGVRWLPTDQAEGGDRRGEAVLTVWRNNFHHLFIKPPGVQPATGDGPLQTALVGRIAVPNGLLEGALSEAAAITGEEQGLRQQLDELIYSAEADGSFHEIVQTVDDAVRHVESLCLYIGDAFFAVVERFTNLLPAKGDGSVFIDLGARPASTWESDERLLLIALYALYISGRSVRFEEFSGKVLTARRLLARLDELARDYRLDAPSLLKKPEALLEVARQIGACAFRQAPEDLFRYRYVNGLTYLKNERVVHRRHRDDSLAAMSPRLHDLASDWLGSSPPDSARALFGDLTRAALHASPEQVAVRTDGTPATSGLELLIQEIVASAVVAVGADYGMSSSLRDPAGLIHADHQQRLAAMLELTPKDFYNCVCSRPGLDTELDGDFAELVYRPVQNRMQFNRWHFVPGNFARQDVPRERHYFYPPMIPDHDEWVDQHHKGHIKAQVRYSIRSPGPDMHEPPLEIAGQTYRGFFDVRVVRMLGPAFQIGDLIVVRRHCQWMDAVWRTWVSALEAGHDRSPIRGFEVGEGFRIPAMTGRS